MKKTVKANIERCIDVIERARLEANWAMRRQRRSKKPMREVIISLTSYPPRFAQLHLTLKSLLLQTMKLPVVLWIAEKDMAALPTSVLDLQSEGLTISSCDDLRSYKKIVPATEAYPDRTIITADDDVYYWRTWAEGLIGASDGQTIVCYRAHRITVSPAGAIRPYREWQWDVAPAPADKQTFPTGMAGILYPRGALRDLPKSRKFLEVCPSGDDIWLYWTWRRAGLVAQNIGPKRRIHLWGGSQETALWHQNVEAQENDVQVRQMIEHFGRPF